jgi:hypothetical protein
MLLRRQCLARVPLFLALLGGLAFLPGTAARADIILGGNELFNANQTAFVTPPPTQVIDPPGSPSSIVISNFPNSGNNTLPYSASYTQSDSNGQVVGSVSGSSSANLNYLTVTPDTVQFTASVSTSASGTSLAGTAWRAGTVETSIVEQAFTVTSATNFVWHETSSESASDAYILSGSNAYLQGPGSGPVATGVSYLDVYGNQGTVPTLDLTVTGVLQPGYYFFRLESQGDGEAGPYYGFPDFQTVASGSVTLTLSPVPEPGSITLLCTSGLIVAGFGWRRRSAGRPSSR